MDGSHSDIAIIGAGMAGLSCASHLAKAGQLVRVFDKGRGPGGRMAARRAEVAGETVSFDHGAQYFTARDPAFVEQVKDWEAQGAAARWRAASKSDDDPAFVGIPGMNGPIRAMADALDEAGGEVCWATRIEDITRSDGRWQLDAGDQRYTCDTVLVAVPAEQASVLLEEASPRLGALAGSVTSAPCWAVMAAFATRLDIEADRVRAEKGPVSWAARNSAKPARNGTECWVVHASPERSRELIDLPKEEAAVILLGDFFAQTQTQPAAPIHLTAHRWLYSQPASLDGEAAHYDAETRIGIAGDYLHSPRVEGAFLSGRALAAMVPGAG